MYKPFSLVKFLYAKLKYPRAASLGFPVMGFGLVDRHHNFRVHWKNHIEHTLAAEQSWLDEISSSLTSDSSLVVLGAGRLFDFNQNLINHFSQICLVDADPFCLPTWKKLSRRFGKEKSISFSIEDVTGILADWKSKFETEISTDSWGSALAKLKEITQHQKSRQTILESVQNYSVISLNLLSQLPLAWQDIVENILSKVFGATFTSEHQSEWLEAFYTSASFLVENHLAKLNLSNAKHILIISDVEYLHYSGELTFNRSSSGQAPFIYQPDRPEDLWTRNPLLSAEKKLNCEVSPALYGVPIENMDYLKSVFNTYNVAFKNTWLWHIVPQGLEDSSKGSIHRVRAIELTKIND
jgi:hypothetical protein